MFIKLDKGYNSVIFQCFLATLPRLSLITAWVLCSLPALGVLFTYRGETGTLEREARGHRVQCVRSGSITPGTRDADFKISSCDKVSSPLFPAGLFWGTESARKQRGHGVWPRNPTWTEKRREENAFIQCQCKGCFLAQLRNDNQQEYYL